MLFYIYYYVTDMDNFDIYTSVGFQIGDNRVIDEIINALQLINPTKNLREKFFMNLMVIIINNPDDFLVNYIYKHVDCLKSRYFVRSFEMLNPRSITNSSLNTNGSRINLLVDFDSNMTKLRDCLLFETEEMFQSEGFVVNENYKIIDGITYTCKYFWRGDRLQFTIPIINQGVIKIGTFRNPYDSEYIRSLDLRYIQPIFIKTEIKTYYSKKTLLNNLKRSSESSNLPQAKRQMIPMDYTPYSETPIFEHYIKYPSMIPHDEPYLPPALSPPATFSPGPPYSPTTLTYSQHPTYSPQPIHHPQPPVRQTRPHNTTIFGIKKFGKPIPISGIASFMNTYNLFGEIKMGKRRGNPFILLNPNYPCSIKLDQNVNITMYDIPHTTMEGYSYYVNHSN